MNLRDIGELETWDRFFDYLVNVYYYRFRQQNNLDFGKLEPEPVVRFGGFILEKPWTEKDKKTRIRCSWQKREPFCQMGKVAVFTHYIYLNRLFLYQQLGFQIYFTKSEEFAKLFDLNITLQKNLCRIFIKL